MYFQLRGSNEVPIRTMGGPHTTDQQSHIFKHSKKSKHRKKRLTDFKIIGKGYRSDFTRKISESLFIKELKPGLECPKGVIQTVTV